MTAPAQPEQPLRQRIDATIRPRMLIGLQDAELYDEPGRERIGEWADSITSWVLAVVQPDLDAKAAEIRTLTAVARSNGEAYKGAVAELDARDAEIQQLRAQLAAVTALHRPVTRGAMTICDACSPKRGDGPARYVLVDYPCPTADAINAGPRPTT